ncbi:MAG: tRNA dimethylallyltransferase, partial [Rhodospirillaceae bacterium]
SLTIALTPPRDALYARIEARLDAMIGAGALDEVAALAAIDPGADQPAMKALGVPDLRRHLVGACDLAEAMVKAKQATRNFAKRQLSWLRHQMAADLVIEDFGDKAFDAALPVVREFLRTGQTRL